MARKTPKARQQPAVPLQPPKPLRGRPPNEPRTTLARWIRGRMTVADFADRLADVAKRLGLPPGAAPRAKTLLDSVNGRHWPHPMTILLTRHATDGDVDLEHWARDLRHLYPNAWERDQIPRSQPQRS